MKTLRALGLWGVTLTLGCAGIISPVTRAPDRGAQDTVAGQSATPAGTTEPGRSASAGDEVATADLKPVLVCHEEKKTGTRISKRVCRTPQQIEEERLKAQKDVHDMGRQTPDWNP